MVKIKVDGRELDAREGSLLLTVCLENGIYIPNLCYIEGRTHQSSSCRLCFVEIAGKPGPVPSCSVPVVEGMEVRTDTEAVRRLQRSALSLLLSVHQVDCGHCPSNKKCELQKIARFLKVGLKPKGLVTYIKEGPLEDNGHPVLEYHPERCVACGRCIHACVSAQGTAYLAFAGRGLKTFVSFFGESDVPDLPCKDCKACVDACPVSAILPRQ